MVYQAVGDLVAVDFSDLERYRVSEEKALAILKNKGFQVVDVNLSEIARNWVGSNMKYRRNAKMSEAPMTVNCSTFVKWLYSLKGIWIPRYALQQQEFSAGTCSRLRPESLIFKTGPSGYYREYQDSKVGHVGIFTDKNTVIHAMDSEPAIKEVSFAEFVMKGKSPEFRGLGTIIKNPEKTKTLRIPPECEIETSDDVNFIIWGSPNKVQDLVTT